MGRYITYADLIGRYESVSNRGGAEEIDSSYIRYAEFELDSRLSPKFTAPFSTNNITARDLSIDIAYSRLMRVGPDSEELRKNIQARIDDLLMGKASMITTSYEVLNRVSQAYANTENFKPVFDMRDSIGSDVSSARLDYDDNNGE